MIRILLYPKDVSTITGKSEKQARVLIKKIKTEQQRESCPFTIYDLSDYLKRDVETIIRDLKL